MTRARLSSHGGGGGGGAEEAGKSNSRIATFGGGDDGGGVGGRGDGDWKVLNKFSREREKKEADEVSRREKERKKRALERAKEIARIRRLNEHLWSLFPLRSMHLDATWSTCQTGEGMRIHRQLERAFEEEKIEKQKEKKRTNSGGGGGDGTASDGSSSNASRSRGLFFVLF